MKKRIILFIILILGMFLIAGCSQDNATSPADNDDAQDTEVADNHDEVESTGEVKEFEIIAKNWEFSPNTIEVNLGDKVELHIESVDVTHGFRLPDFGINEVLEPHNDIHVEFIADKKGTFAFSCSVPCGRGHGGMSGQLIVK